MGGLGGSTLIGLVFNRVVEVLGVHVPDVATWSFNHLVVLAGPNSDSPDQDRAVINDFGVDGVEIVFDRQDHPCVQPHSGLPREVL